MIPSALSGQLQQGLADFLRFSFSLRRLFALAVGVLSSSSRSSGFLSRLTKAAKTIVIKKVTPVYACATHILYRPPTPFEHSAS